MMAIRSLFLQVRLLKWNLENAYQPRKGKLMCLGSRAVSNLRHTKRNRYLLRIRLVRSQCEIW